MGFTCEIYTGGAVLNGPRITVTDPYGNEQSIGLDPTYAIAADTTVVFDTTNRTVVSQRPGSTTESLERYLFAPLQWPQLRPGVNPLAPTTAGGKERQAGYNRIAYTQVGGAPDPLLTITVKHYAADLA